MPPLRVGDTASHTVYYEARTNDSRLALATVTAAARSGAVVANYLRAVDLDLAPGRISRVSLQGRRGEITLRCRAVVGSPEEHGGFRLRASDPPEQRNPHRPSTG